MSDTRATKSGINAEVEAKQRAKYDPQLASEALQWISRTAGVDINTSGEMDSFIDVLKSGVVLCKLANALQPGSVKCNETSKMAFVQMENVGKFLKFLETTAGVNPAESFVTCDLYEAQNPYAVLMAICALARKAEKFGKEGMGPKESTGQKRDWTEDQLKAGRNVIGLQMGTNKGASQSGMGAFGNARHIVD